MRLVPQAGFRGFLALALAGMACSGGGGDGPKQTGTIPGTTTVLTTVVVTAPPGVSGNLVAGQTLQLNAAPRDQSGNTINATVTWSSSANTVATVSTTGLVTAVGAGTATITATATTATATTTSNFLVTVAAPAPVLTSVTVTGTTTVTAGQTTQLTASPKDQNGAAIAAAVSWTTSAAGVATVSQSGLVTGVTAGTATITATALSGSTTVTGTAVVTVQAAAAVLTSVTLTPATTSLQAGSTLQLTASPKDQNGNAITATVTWSSSATNIASVSQTGLVTAVAAGNATITAQATSGGQTVNAQRAMTITAVPPVLTAVGVTGGTSVVVGGGTLQLTASPVDQFGNAIAATVTWASSNTGRATVSNTGLVTGVAGGGVTITATATAGGTSVDGALGITSLILTSVQISGGSSVNVGSTLQLSATAKDQNGGTLAGAVLAWSSSDNTRATVNGSGLVTGVAVGTPNITAQATLGSAVVSAFRTVTVNSAAFPASANVATLGSSFNPSSVDIALNGTVNFSGLSGHNVIFEAASGAPADIVGPASGSRQFATSGTFAYYCSIHGGTGGFGMSGTVIVH